MSKKIRWITETAVLLALLIVLQSVTKPFGQLVTGSCVNTVLAIASLFVGMGSGITIALISPVLAFMLGIAPQAVTVPAIMVGNTAFVVLLNVLYGRSLVKQVSAWLASATAMFAWPQLFTALIGGAMALIIVPVLKKALKK